jgi:hypothetical protein
MKLSAWRKLLRAFALVPSFTGVAFFAGTSTGYATVAVIDCSADSAALVSLAGSGPLNGSYAIKGACTGNPTILNSDAVIQQDAGGGSITGSLAVKQSNLALEGITLDGGGAGSSSGILIGDFGPGSSGLKPSTVSLVGATVKNYTMFGVVVSNGTLLTSNATITQNSGCGVFARFNARVQLASTSITANGNDLAVFIPGGRCGVHAENGAAVVTNDVIVSGNNGPALWLSQATADVENSTLSSSSPASFPAIVAQSGTRNLVSVGVDGGIFADSGSRLTARANTITQATAAVPAIFVADGSQFVSLGGNQISNSAAGALALTLQNGSIYRQRNESMFFGPLQSDQITGSAFVQVQSSLEIGAGLVAGLPSITWSIPSGNCILIQQNSSIRLSGGVEIDGAPPAACTLNGGLISTSIVIQQESNGFFNVSQGGTDAFTGGGGVSCVFTSFPNAHVQGKANITPAGAQLVMIGNLQQALSASSPGCEGP